MADSVADLQLLSSGKVREIYALEDDLLMVASDRISAYDVVLPDPIPDKGAVLTQMSIFWFDLLGDVVPNHFISEDVPPEARGRGMRVQKLEMHPVECVVRGYITGSGWKEDKQAGTVCGIELPQGLEESQKLPEPIFTPATKAEIGEHDENIDFERAVEVVGDRELMTKLRDTSIELYNRAAEHAASKGIILADTKFEFGRAEGEDVVLGDEVFTPDSSRFWPADSYEPGHGQPSFDKQYVRDWLPPAGPAPATPPPTSSTCAIGSTSRAGTTPRRARTSPRRSSSAPGPATSRPTS